MTLVSKLLCVGLLKSRRGLCWFPVRRKSSRRLLHPPGNREATRLPGGLRSPSKDLVGRLKSRSPSKDTEGRLKWDPFLRMQPCHCLLVYSSSIFFSFVCCIRGKDTLQSEDVGSVTVSLYLRMDWTLENGSEPPREVPNGTPRKGREKCWMWATP